MGIWQGVARNTLKFHLAPPCLTFLRPAPETALQLFQGWPARRAGGQWPSSTPLDTPCPTPTLYSVHQELFMPLFTVESWPLRGFLVEKNTNHALRVARPHAADMQAGDWLPTGRIVMTP
jgi:hypothetical protein